MAVMLEFNVILVRKAEIDTKYPGGLSQFRIDWLVKPPERWCEDEHLIGFSSMGGYYDKVRTSLKSCGAEVLDCSQADSPERMKSQCDWLDCDFEPLVEVPLGASGSYGIRYWLKGFEPGETVGFSRKPFAPPDTER